LAKIGIWPIKAEIWPGFTKIKKIEDEKVEVTV